VVDDFLGALSGQPALVLPLVFGERRGRMTLWNPWSNTPTTLAVLEEFPKGSQTALDRGRCLK